MDQIDVKVIDTVTGDTDIVQTDVHGRQTIWQLRPDGYGNLTVRLDARPPVLTIIPSSGNSVVLKALGAYGR